MNERIEFKTFTKMSKNSIVDFKELITYAKNLGQEALAITDYNSSEIFPKVDNYLKTNNIHNFKIIYGTVVNMLENDFLIPITILVRNQKGLKNLYKIISQIKTTNLVKYNKEVITRKELEHLSEGLLYGVDTNFMMNIYEDLTNEQIKADLIWYDFVEVKSFKNSKKDYLTKIIKLASDIPKIVIATGDVHYVKNAEENDYKIIFPNLVNSADKYLKSTAEMLNDFNFLNNQELANKLVIKNPHLLASLIEDIKIFDDEICLPKIKDSQKIFLNMVYKKAHKLYGNKLHPLIEKRIEEELYGKDKTRGIINNHYEVIYLIYQKLVLYSHKLGYDVCPRGSVASSFIAYLIGITNINPLPPHYYCPLCQETIFLDNDSEQVKECDKCHTKMIIEGFNIPYETFLGFNSEKIPDIDLNFADVIQKDIHNYLQEMWGEDYTFKAGTIGTLSIMNAQEIIWQNWEASNLELDKGKMLDLAIKLDGLKKRNGIHPGSLFVISKDKEIFDFTPIIYPYKDKFLKATHLDYHDLAKNIYKFDLLGFTILTKLKELEDLTKVKIKDIPLNDHKTLDLLKKGDTYGIFEFDSDYIRKIIKVLKPTTLADFIKISGIVHGEGVWNNNGEELVKNNISLTDIITCRDDIMTYLIKHQLDDYTSFEIMETVCHGKAQEENAQWVLLKQKMIDAKIEDWFINSCQKIKYLFPKAHCVSYTLKAYQLSWYKVHFPTIFATVIKE